MLGVKLLMLSTLFHFTYGNCLEEECVFSKWSDWTGCICAICDDTEETKQSCFRTRSLLENAEGCRSECGATFESGCIGQCCNELCAVTDWNQWSACACSEGELVGRQFRNRTGIEGHCLVPCSIMAEERNCHDVCCPEDCQLGEWNNWSGCSVECYIQVGYKTRGRDMIQGTCGGDMCSVFESSEVQPCNGVCQLTEWSVWNCTCAPCITNSTFIFEHCIRGRETVGNCSTSCGDLVEESCSEKDDCCDPNCALSSWSEWSECSAPCDSTDFGTQERSRSNTGQCAGRPCQNLEDIRSCNASCCARDCSAGEWGQWTECTLACESDVGKQVRTRHVTQGSCGGSVCDEDDWHDVRLCQGACLLDNWSDWVCVCSSCDETDPEGLYRECSRRRGEVNPEICNGNCGSLFEYKCEGNCCDELCTVGEWSEWTQCNAPCGINAKGNITRQRQPSEFCNGEPCESVQETKECSTSSCCPQDCVIHSWESWSACNGECSVDEGKRVRYRPFTQGSCNGTLCTEGDRFEIESCQGSCNVSHWSEWSCDCQPCSERNESVTYNFCTRNRTVPVSEECNICDQHETICKDFEQECCDDSCTAGEWTQWTTCSVGCETHSNGTQERTRPVSGSCNGRPCFDLYDQRVCGDECCPVNCTIGTWQEWSVCNSGCNTIIGSEARFRDVFQGSCGGYLCEETDGIEVRSCYGNCEVSIWSEWNCVCSACSDNNSTFYNDCLRTRTEINDCHGLNPCGSLFERTCLDECCNELCDLSTWTEWTPCSAECMSEGVGFQYRERSIDDSCISDPCDILFENRTCTATDCCPSNCTLGDWESWSECSSVCNDLKGFRVRYRDYDQGYCGGKMCTNDDASEVDMCRGNCTLTPWSTWSCMCELCSDKDDRLHDSCIRERSQEYPDNCLNSDVCGSLVERGCFDVCCDRFCAVTEWQEWGSCTAECDTDNIGEQIRQRSPVGLCQSDPCVNLTETRSCLAGCCPVDCLMGKWTKWFACSSTCQHITGQQIRVRDIQQAHCGGINCTIDDNYETRACYGECVLSEWSRWNCSCTICDPNDINFHEECFRTRHEVNPEVCNGKCGELMETTCSVDDCCDEYCELSEWSDWSECDAPCGINMTGVIERERHPIAACFSDPCVEVYETVNCLGPECCSVDCQLGDWGIWSSCSSICSNENGLRYRVREIMQGSCGGQLCPDNSGTETASCRGNCSLTEWTEWNCKCNFCDLDGVLRNDCIRQRYEIEPADCSGESCGSLVERLCSEECCDEFCLLSEWSNWSSCLIDCSTSGIATKERQREPVVWCLSPPCNTTTDISFCDDVCCPEDCILGHWNEWLPCSSKCSDMLGTQTRKRSMIQGSCGGMMCSEETPYETRVCYGECEVTNWSEWNCNCAQCNPENNKMYYNCTRERSSTLDGYCYDHCSTVVLTCDDECCDDLCNLTNWSDWTECTALCGQNSTSSQHRYRNFSASCIGSPCGDLVESRTCHSPDCCPVNCTVGPWSAWTTCSVYCSSDTGMQHRIREIQNGSCGGAICNTTDERIDRRACIGKCLVSEWTPWSCGCGFCGNSSISRQNCSRQRQISNPDLCVMADYCHIEENTCGEVCCEDECTLSEWTDWSNCSKPCDSHDTGIEFRERHIANECNADPCEMTYEERGCTPSCCPRDCKLGSWGTWSQCSVLCYFDVGVQFRSRDISLEVCGGRPCINNTDVYQVQHCVGPCDLAEWSEWTCECSSCNETTDALYKNCTRTRIESRLDLCSENCGHTMEIECLQPCCDPDCEVTEWSSWSPCNLECGVTGNGEQERYRSVASDTCVGEPCVSLVDKQNCTSDCCPIDCSIGAWSDWSNCSTHCSFDVGNKRRTRTIIQAECGGVECVDVDGEDVAECNGTCVLSQWSQWSCGCAFCILDDRHLYNMCTRTRYQSSECLDFESCGVLQEESCGEQCCDNFCFVGDWSEWTECTATCVNGTVGTQERSRPQISQLCLGPPCDPLLENRACNSTCCPENCLLLDWSDWSPCSSECTISSGTRRRTRNFIQGSCGGDMCTDEITETGICTSECVLSEWNEWSCQCNFCSPGDLFLSTVCSRERGEIGSGCNGQCGSLTETICDRECCDDFCFVGEWTMWSQCNHTCGSDNNGVRNRTRHVISNVCLGKPCDNVEESEDCLTECCPRNCDVGEWSPWTECSASCTMSIGIQTRTRNVTQPECGGECPTELNEREEQNCTGHCQITEWSSWDCSCGFCKPDASLLYSHCERTRTEDGPCDGQCGPLFEEKCVDPCCDDFCATDEWSSWSDCSNGVTARNRKVISDFCFGDPCGGITDERVCHHLCCIYTEWTTWSNCSTLCAEDVGTQSRNRDLESACHENVCNETTDENRACNGDCQPSDWSDWVCACSFCQSTSQLLFNNCHRSRTDDRSASCLGACGPIEEITCSVECCDEFCFWSEWDSWSECQQGGRVRTRVQTSTFCIGSPCGSDTDTDDCNPLPSDSVKATLNGNILSNGVTNKPPSAGITSSSGTHVGGKTTVTSIVSIITPGDGTTTRPDIDTIANVVNTNTPGPIPVTSDVYVFTMTNVGSTTTRVDGGTSSQVDGATTVSVGSTTTRSHGGTIASVGGTTTRDGGGTTSSVDGTTTRVGSPTTSGPTISGTITPLRNTRRTTISDTTTSTLDVTVTSDLTAIVQFDVCSSTPWTSWSDCHSPCLENNPQQYRYRQLVPMICNKSQCIETQEETRNCQGTFHSRKIAQFDVHKEMVILHNITSENSDILISRFFTSKCMRERLLIRNKHLAAFGNTINEYLRDVISSDAYSCISVLLESNIQSKIRLLNHLLTSETFDAESILEILVPLNSQDILEIQNSYKKEYNVSLESTILSSETDPAQKRLIISLLLGMRAENRLVNSTQITNDVNLIFNGDDIDIQSVLAIRSFGDIQRIYEEFSSSHGDLSDFLAEKSDNIHTTGYVKIVEYAMSSVKYWATVIHHLINAGLPVQTSQLQRVLIQRAEIDLLEIIKLYKDLYDISLEDAVHSNYNGTCVEQIIGLINQQ